VINDRPSAWFFRDGTACRPSASPTAAVTGPPNRRRPSTSYGLVASRWLGMNEIGVRPLARRLCRKGKKRMLAVERSIVFQADLRAFRAGVSPGLVISLTSHGNSRSPGHGFSAALRHRAADARTDEERPRALAIGHLLHRFPHARRRPQTAAQSEGADAGKQRCGRRRAPLGNRRSARFVAAMAGFSAARFEALAASEDCRPVVRYRNPHAGA